MRGLRHPSLVPLALVAAALLALALATLIEGKLLWAAYNVVGAALVLAFAALVARFDLALPRAASALCLAALLLHYVGGSLSGHFGVEGVNGLYAVFPWWDRITHFAGAAGVALLAFHLLAHAGAARGWRLPDAPLALFAFALAVSVGVGVELFEFGAWTFFGTIDQGFYSNTMMDLYGDVAGAAFGASVAFAARRARAERSAGAAAREEPQ